MATSTIRLPLSSSFAKSSNLHDLIGNFYTLVEQVKQKHENEIGLLNQQIKNLESENKQLRTIHQEHSHSIFDIDYVSNESSTITQLRTELERSHKQIDALQTTLNQQYLEYEDMKSKYSLQRLMNENNLEQQNSNTDSHKIKELELKFQQIKDQIQQFDQCNYESEEQIRLLKQLISANDSEPMKNISQSLTVKQADLFQQTDIVENILNKQQDKILEKIMELFDQNPLPPPPPTTTTTTGKTRKTKRKRL